MANGNVLPIYKEDLKEREIFGYPPFKNLIKITFSGNEIETQKARMFISESLKEYNPQIFSAFIGKIKNQFITNMVIKLDPKDWPLLEIENQKLDPKLKEILSNLPPNFSIDINPENLL
jgi:primosomal protein N'